jgi:TetR/AcrR family transcriptional regulator
MWPDHLEAGLRRRNEDTRLRILSTAERRFAQRGYDATGVAELCRSAGVSKGAFYHHFASKHDLFLELLDSWLAALDSAFAAAVEQADDVPTALRGMADLVAEGIRRPEQRLGMFVEFWAHAQRDPAIWRRAAEPYRRYLAYFERLIAKGIEQRRFRQIAPERAASLLTSMALGLLMQASFAPDDEAWSDTLRGTVEMFLEGLEDVRR